MNKLTKEKINYYMSVLKRCANRESTVQFYNGIPTENEQYFIGRKEESNQDFLALVLDYDKETKEALIEQRNFFKVGDTIEAFGPNKEATTIKVESLMTESLEKVDAARHPQERLKLKTNVVLDKFDILRVKLDK